MNRADLMMAIESVGLSEKIATLEFNNPLDEQTFQLVVCLF